MSWFDNSTGGYDLYLQRLDASGNEQWAHNGVLIADRSFSSTQAYDLAVDTAGHAVLALRDDRLAGIQITATRVDDTGTQVWGAAGLQMTSTTDFVGSPRIAATTDGNIVVAWTQEDNTVLQKLDAAGGAQWGIGVTLSDSGGSSFSASDLNTSDDGAIIISLVRGFLSPTYYADPPPRSDDAVASCRHPMRASGVSTARTIAVRIIEKLLYEPGKSRDLWTSRPRPRRT